MPTLNKNQQNLEEEMKKHPVLTFADIIKALKEHPEWLEELRKIILTTELIELPRKIEKLFESVRKLEKRVGKIEEDVAVLKQDVAVLKQDVAVLKKDVAYLKGEFGRFKGREFERTIREKYYAYFGRLLRKSKLVNFEEILPLLESAEDEGLITEEQKLSVFQLDLLVSGMLKSTKKEVFLAVEVSYSLHEQDVERSVERADILAYLLKKEVIPVLVAVEVKKEVEKKVENKGALLIKTEF
ncbi:MAG: hypothetical protein J7K20_02585 [Thermodesulfobacterium sp.]|nr:hypothetical protein [Thermodesulfobacterium sp.]